MKKINAATLGILTLLLFSCEEKSVQNKENQVAEKQEMLFPKGEKVPNDKFTGTVYQAILSDEGTRVSNVTFGRTNWHNHPGGQTLW